MEVDGSLLYKPLKANKKPRSLITRAAKPRKEKLAIYLAKSPSATDEELLKIDDAKPAVEIKINFGTAKLYVKRELPKGPPIWSKFFTTHQQLDSDLFGSTSSVGAVFVVRDHQNIFILSFGTGHHLIKSDVFERDFGLRVTLNSVHPDKLRSLDKASYQDNPLNSRTQSASEVDIFQLNLDSELELMYAVTGVSTVSCFGGHITGRDALNIAVAVKIDGLSEILLESIIRYKKKLPPEFEWVDNINRVRDAEECEILDLELDDVLSKGDFTNLYLGEPEIVDWENHAGYSFDLRPNTERHFVLELEDFITYLGLEGRPVVCADLKAGKVHINDSEYRSVKHWSAYRCLYAEVKIVDKQYVLRNGIWYRVTTDFVKTIDVYLNLNIEAYDRTLPIYNHDREDQYNEFVVDNFSEYYLMDKNNVKIGGPSDKIEFCDLLHAKDFIHVKYYRSSGTLSHLFSQAVVAAHTFLGEAQFRVKLNEKLPAPIKLNDPIKRPAAEEYKVVYAIATSKKIPIELPFFSKVSLKHAIRALQTFGFNVALCQIEVDPIILKKKSYRPKSAAKK